MSLPSVSLTALDGALGLTPPAANGVQVKVGVCSGGTNNTLYRFNDPKKLKDTLGTGPVVEAAAHLLNVAGGIVYVCKAEADAAGSQGSWTLTGTGPSPGCASTGTPLDGYQVIVLIVRGGTRGTATFKVSFDNGDTYSPEYATAASITTFAAETGLTLTFATGTYVAGDLYKSTSTAPGFTTTSLGAALDVLSASTVPFEGFHVVGQAADMTGFNAVFAAVGTKLSAMESAFRYVWAILELPDVSDATVSGDATFAAASNSRIFPCLGMAEIVSPINARIYRRSTAWAASARVAKIPLQRDPGRVRDGALPGVSSISHDERTAAIAFHDLGVTTTRTFTPVADSGTPGFYLSGIRGKVALTSDFRDLPNRRVLDRACTIAYVAALQWLNEELDTNAAPGTVEAPAGSLTDPQARSIEDDINAKLSAGLVAKDYAQAASVVVNRTNDVSTTEEIQLDVRVRPKGYARTITVTVGFSKAV